MAVRVTVDDVRAIIDTTLEDTAIEPYIASANVWVNAVCEPIPLEEEVLFEIERWMSAHMIAMTQERVAKEEGAGGAYIKYAGDWGMGLTQTPYGQMVVNLDPSGTLASLAKGKGSASIYAVPGV